MLTELFRWNDEGVGPDGKLKGTLKASGLRPHFFSKLESHGLKSPRKPSCPTRRSRTKAA